MFGIYLHFFRTEFSDIRSFLKSEQQVVTVVYENSLSKCGTCEFYFLFCVLVYKSTHSQVSEYLTFNFDIKVKLLRYFCLGISDVIFILFLFNILFIYFIYCGVFSIKLSKSVWIRIIKDHNDVL